MVRTTAHLTLLAIAALAMGCGVSSPKLPKSINPSLVNYTTELLEVHRCRYEEAATGKECQTTPPSPNPGAREKDLEMAKFWRNTMISMIRRDIESFYNEYEKQLAISRRRFSSAVEVTSLAGVAAATITNGARPKTVIATMVAFVEGAHGKIDENIFQQQTTTIIIQKIRASRARADALILQNMDLDATQYTFGEAEHDLRELFQAGTLQSGFLELAASAGHDATQAAADKKAIQVRHTIPIATAAQRELAKKISNAVTKLEKRWVDNPNRADGQKALEEILKALNALKTSGQSSDPSSIPAAVPTDRDGAEKLIRLLRKEMADADTSTEKREKKMPALAAALEIN